MKGKHMSDKQITLKNDILDGKRIGYHSETLFLVQVGRYRKGSFKTRYTFTGELGRAVMFYNGINLGNGYKKRLIAPSFNKPLLARQASY